MADIWLTSDWHLGEERMNLMLRPFETAEQQFQRLLAEHNALVQPEDLVIFLGDLCNKEHPEELPRVDEFNGRKWILRGNHDRTILDKDFLNHFERVFSEETVLTSNVGGIPISLNHYPSKADRKFFHLCGHIHSIWKFQLNAMNCGVDVHNFQPVNLNQIPFFLSAISEYYDEDAWVAYHFPNSHHRGKRGKPGTYNEASPIFVPVELEV